MLLRQKSAFNGFAYEFLEDGTQTVLGEFHYAWFAQAKNARLRLHSLADAAQGDIQLRLNGRSWRVRHLYLRRGYTNDIRYTLETAQETLCAQVDVLTGPAGQRQPRVVMDHPMRAELSTSPGWLRKQFNLTDRNSRQPLGTLQERSALSTRREMQIEVPGCAAEVAAFWGIVVLIVRF